VPGDVAVGFALLAETGARGRAFYRNDVLRSLGLVVLREQG